MLGGHGGRDFSFERVFHEAEGNESFQDEIGKLFWEFQRKFLRNEPWF
jgi:transcriptional regulator with GAF, ATPase, and Fis domain